MEGDRVYRVGVGIIMLDESLRPDIPYFDCVIRRRGGNASSIGVETDGVDPAFVIRVLVDEVLLVDVPQLDALIVGTRANKSGVG